MHLPCSILHARTAESWKITEDARVTPSKEDTSRSVRVEETPQEQRQLMALPPGEQGGYDCKFVERPQELETDCPVCLRVFRDPFQVTCCGKSFCQSCIKCLQADKESCPNCNEADFDVYPNERLRRLLYACQVRCVHLKSGCEWTGGLGELDSHLNLNPELDKQLIGCAFAAVACTRCLEYFQRRHVHTHESESCPQRPFSCDYCHDYSSVSEDLVNSHWPVCKCYPVPCPNDCGLYPERQNVEAHLNTVCPLTVVKCDFHYTGCEVQLVRKDMRTHLTESLATHISLLTTQTQTLADKSELLPYLSLLALHNQQLTQLTVLQKQTLEELGKENESLKLEVKKGISQEVAELRRQQKASLEENRHKLQELERTGKHEIEALKQRVKEQEVVALRKMQKENLEETKRKIRELDREKGTQATVITELRKCSDTSKREIQGKKLKMNLDISQEVAELGRQQKESLEESHCKIQELVREGKHEIEALKRKVNKDVEQEVARLRKVQKECVEESQHRMQEFERKTQSQHTLITELQQFCDTSKREIEALKLKVNKDVLQEVAELRKQQKENDEESQQKILELERQNKVQATQLQKYADTNEYEIEILKLKGSMDVEEQVAGVRKKLMHELEKEKQSRAIVCAELQKCSYSSKREIEALKLKVNKDMEQEVAELRRQQKESLEKGHHILQELERDKQKQATVLAQLQECSDKSEHQIGALNQVKMDVEQKVAELRRQQKEKKESCEEILQELERQRQGVTAQVQKCSDESERQIKALTVDVEQKVAELSRQQDQHRASLATLQMHVQIFPPIKFTVTTECEWPWNSFPFYSHPQGYKMCLKVFPHGYGIGVGTHVSVFVQLMKGDFDDCLQWPFQGTVVLQLCNQLQDKYHYGDTIDFSLPADHSIINRVTSGEVTEGSEWGTYTFIAHEFLNFNSTIYCQYLVDNSLFFRILAVECLSKPGVLPTELTMANFEQHKIDNDCWSSPQFFTHPQGYKMGLEVYVSRFYDDCNTYISVYVHLLRGEFDGYLKWPFHGYVTVAMLNQLEDKNHAIETIRFSDATEYAGNRSFIAHTQLNYQPTMNCQYLKYDCLRFRIVKVELL